ncbi:protein-arginine deiminase type-2-like [Crotalus adamanteus]|uniref:Protein-arginine deiminase type-2-like n=1 Tax=Crotalus adamanteus TaxID=8729 RepID=A0AAW1AQE6_CROAD
MLRDRTLRLQFGHRLEAVYLLGTRLSVDVFGAAPPEAVNFNVKHSQEVSVEVISQDQSDFAPADGVKQWPLDPGTFLQIQMTQPSLETNESKVTVGYYEENGEHPINQAGVFLTGIGISLDVDADRDGVVEKNNPKKRPPLILAPGKGAAL